MQLALCTPSSPGKVQEQAIEFAGRPAAKSPELPAVIRITFKD
jgi:hypothetical protein